MADPEYRVGECAETSGFLFSHACGEFAITECASCGKPICHRHAVPDEEEGTLCISCAKQRQRQSGRDLDDEYDSDDPYFYAGHYYAGYYWDSDDFTDSDEAVLSGGEAGDDDLRAFEDDMGAS